MINGWRDGWMRGRMDEGKEEWMTGGRDG